MIHEDGTARSPAVSAALGLGLIGLVVSSTATRAPAQGVPAPAAPAAGAACARPAELQRALIPAIQTDQDRLNNVVNVGGKMAMRPSGYPFPVVQANGRHLFTTPFVEIDGAGEGTRPGGPLGPREASYNSNLRLVQGKLGLPDSDFGKLLDVLKPPFATVEADGNVRFPILRLNGLDSQSCFECHNSIGSAHPDGDAVAASLERKPGTTGGPAGQASNAFINDPFPNPALMFVRNPPHVFGTGYAQGLAEEMTVDLILQKVGAYVAASLAPGKQVAIPLAFRDPKGRPIVSFGNFKVTYVGPGAPPTRQALVDTLLADADADLTRSFVEDQAEVQGVSRDLVVRPFQWKGIASNERNFVRSAMNFHFGMMPRELNPNYMMPNEVPDSDNDGVPNEVSEGNVSALAIFTTSIRPPSREVLPENRAIAERGEKLFRGEAVPGVPAVGAAVACTNCHMPTLPLYNPRICIRDPRAVDPDPSRHLSGVTSLVARESSSAHLPVYRRLRARMGEAMRARADLLDGERLGLRAADPRGGAEAVRAALAAAIEPVGCPSAGFEFDLNMAPGSEFESLSFSYPRLPTVKDPDGKAVIDVPLFSDLKRHDMGEGLADKFDQPTDVASIAVVRREFLTRPLWGVADTGPWLHDGRARTLRDAILLHESLGSEANPTIDAFKALSCDDQAAVVEFLLTLRLSVECRYGPCFDHPADCHPGPLPPSPR